MVVFLDEYPDETPFDAMRYVWCHLPCCTSCPLLTLPRFFRLLTRYLISEANYGGRVTEAWDRRLVNVYIAQFFCDAALTEGYALSESQHYFIPPDGDLNSVKGFIKSLPQADQAVAFGQHNNADIASLIEDTNNLLGTLVSLQPKVVVEGEDSDEVKVLRQVRAFAPLVPPVYDMRELKIHMDNRSDPDPMKTVLFQEIERYVERALRCCCCC